MLASASLSPSTEAVVTMPKVSKAATGKRAAASGAQSAASGGSAAKVSKAAKTRGGTASSGRSRSQGDSTQSPADRFLEEQRALLLAERRASLEKAESLMAEAEQLAAEMEPGDIQFDEESGEGATMNVERERDLALSAQARAAVEEIDRALARIDAGTYGICDRCGQPIPKARLKALPSASLCVACKSGGLGRR